jgi:hypothetical protein
MTNPNENPEVPALNSETMTDDDLSAVLKAERQERRKALLNEAFESYGGIEEYLDQAEKAETADHAEKNLDAMRQADEEYRHNAVLAWGKVAGEFPGLNPNDPLLIPFAARIRAQEPNISEPALARKTGTLLMEYRGMTGNIRKRNQQRYVQARQSHMDKIKQHASPHDYAKGHARRLEDMKRGRF